MKVIDPNETTHTISIIPRIYSVGNNHTFVLVDSDTKEETTNSNITKSLNAGYIDYQFSLTTSEGKDYSYKITDNTTGLIVHRGNLFATDQTTQNYRLNG